MNPGTGEYDSLIALKEECRLQCRKNGDTNTQKTVEWFEKPAISDTYSRALSRLLPQTCHSNYSMNGIIHKCRKDTTIYIPVTVPIRCDGTAVWLIGDRDH